jgi:repressor LexA
MGNAYTELTDRQLATLDFIRQYIARHGRSPKLVEVADGIGIQSRGVAHRYVQALVDAGLLEHHAGRHRGLRIVEDEVPPASPLELPLAGRIAAGLPIEAIEGHDRINLADFLLGEGRFVLRVKGDSMMDAGILDGDLVVIQSQPTARNGEIAVVILDREEATLKYFFRERDGSIRLDPANSSLSPMRYSAERVEIRGIVVAQLRSY